MWCKCVTQLHSQEWNDMPLRIRVLTQLPIQLQSRWRWLVEFLALIRVRETPIEDSCDREDCEARQRQRLRDSDLQTMVLLIDGTSPLEWVEQLLQDFQNFHLIIIRFLRHLHGLDKRCSLLSSTKFIPRSLQDTSSGVGRLPWPQSLIKILSCFRKKNRESLNKKRTCAFR